jgi:adenosylcobinamide-phosphate synthase
LHIALFVIFAVALDRLIGEPKGWHPLVIFGRVVSRIENIFWRPEKGLVKGRCQGLVALFAVMFLTLSFFSMVMAVASWVIGGEAIFTTMIVYGCIASRSLKEHALAIAKPLNNHLIDEARQQLKLIVSRDVDSASERDIASATCESVLENGSDGIFSALFWFVVAGVPGVIIYRAANTLDAMWGYKNDRYEYFGWAAAKFDDVLNWLPARLVALSYALMGRFDTAMRCWREQADYWKSPNAGPVMAAGAGSLNIQLGGSAYYHGKLQYRPILGRGEMAHANDIYRALALVDRTLILWLICIVLIFGV